MDDVAQTQQGQSDSSSRCAEFVHLRVHSAYSLSESTLHIGQLAELAAQHNMPALGITDSFNMFGAYEFSQKIASKGVKPVIGVSVTLEDEAGVGNIVILAQNESGYIRLSELVSDALLTNDPASEPRLKAAALAEGNEGLIVLSGGYFDGFLGQPAYQQNSALAAARADWLKQCFQDRAYIELQRHGRASEAAAEAILLEIADNTGLMLVATNDCHFDKTEMFVSQRVLSCIAASERLASMSKRAVTAHHFFKSADEMTELFADIPEAVQNSVIIAKRCSYMVTDREPILPSASDDDEADVLRGLAIKGLEMRLEKLVNMPDSYFDNSAERHAEYKSRLQTELDIIVEMGFAGYFLIVSDFIRWSKEQNIPVGPGRGSGAGSLVAWALLITDLDPMRWGLLFERFLNPERISMPDFDIDFCQERREEVIRYVQSKYGHDKVAQIITFGTLQARAALRDVGRVLDMSYGQVDRIAKLVPSNPAKPVSIAEALKTEEPLKQMYQTEEQVAHLIDTARQLEGLYRHASTHAAGLVIGDRALPELVPLYRDPRSDMPVTQFNMKSVEQVGLVKFDFLGLKTLTVIQRAIELLKRRDIEIDINTIPLDDPATFTLLTSGDTVGVFQLESAGMRDVLRGLKPDRFEDIIAVVALYRPGPMENIPLYISRKHGKEPVAYMHPLLETILDETYGIMIYQEQVQQAARVLAGYTLGGADILRRAMGKKIKAEMDEQREIFISGAEQNNIEAKLASGIFDQIASFAGYGFNKSHAAAYALVSYQTAWLKANYPVEFMAASMALDATNTDKLSLFRQDCQFLGIDVLPPDINASEPSFITEMQADKVVIRYALGAVKNVGSEAMSSLVKERAEHGAYRSLNDFASRLPKAAGNKKQIENLAKAGAFDSLHQNRRQVVEAAEQILNISDLSHKENTSDQVSLFGADTGTEVKTEVRFSDGPDYSASDRLDKEHEALGLYLSAHPLDSYAQQLEKLSVVNASQLEELMQGKEQIRVKLAGQKTQLRENVSARGNRFAFAGFSDRSGSFELTLFSEVLLQAKPLLEADIPLLITADAKNENGSVRMLGVRIQSLDEAIAQNQTGLGIWINDKSCLEQIKACLAGDGAGMAPVKFYVATNMGEVELTLEYRFRLSGQLRQKLKSIAGISKIQEI